MGNKRDLFRIAMDRAGEIRRGTEVSPCTVLDLTEKGFQLRADVPVQVGERLELVFLLEKDAPLQCTVEVTHLAAPQFGSRITSISSEHQACLAQFIEQVNALNLTGF